MIPGIRILHLSDPTHTNLLSFVAILLQDRDDCGLVTAKIVYDDHACAPGCNRIPATN